ncbi:phosphate acetyltransferase [Lutimonas zeaxanthinifaciens]|uniref:phosphate acetyltransferase n=1 Tax=Lutimonas zeaxanthinifaciens TaxID=3060215 RepID=UPI00265C94AF|nr:phosphate acetyltransferase [Lutimonas sp. YSD2104]WKK66886.1 phosphate acetyltransferase [Lutimonas sp. YSD2104]
MSRAIYIATGEAESGKSIITLGLMSILLGRTRKVGYFRPIIEVNNPSKKDNHIETVLTHFNLEMEYEDCYALTGAEVIKKKTKGQEGEILDIIIKKYKELEDRFDFILVEGTDFSGEAVFVELDVNAVIAKNLGIPVILVGSGKEKSNEELLTNLHLAYDSFAEKEVKILGIVANKVDENEVNSVSDDLEAMVDEKTFVGVIPMIKSLNNPTIKEIAEELGAKVLIGENQLDNQVENSAVGAMQLRNFLIHLKQNCLVITPGDRADVILSSLQASLSDNYPKIAGIVLTGGLQPEDSVMKLISGLREVVPILAINRGTFEVANRIGAIRSHIYPSNEQRIYTSLNTFDKYVNIGDLTRKYLTFKPKGLTPRMFQYDLLRKAQKAKKHIVLPEGTDDRILLAAARLTVLDIVELTLLGSRSSIQEKMKELGVSINLDKVHIVNPEHSPHFEDYVNTFYELRKHKNINISMARDLMHDVSFFGTMMVYKGHADGMVSGAVNTTQHTIRPALQFIKTKPGVSVVSSIFFMCLDDRVSVFGDCAINPNPTAEQLAEIAISSADSSAAFGIEPKVAMLSYSSGSSGQGADVDKVRMATEIVKEKRPDIKIEGPIQYDAAVDIKVGKKKLPDSEVAGEASVLIFPDLNTGNNTYKAVQRETGAIAIGPMLQGLNKPVNDLSRGCTVDDIFNTVIITAIQAQQG